MLRLVRAAIAAVAIGAIAACSWGTSASPSATAQDPPARECPSVDLRGPDGTAVDLEGTWIGIGERGALPWPGTYEFELLNSCVAWVGRSIEEGEEVGASWMNVFIGTVNSNLTISGDWAVIPARGTRCQQLPGGCIAPGVGSGQPSFDRARGTLVLRIDHVETAEGTKVRLVLQELTAVGRPLASAGQGYFMTGLWVRPGDEALLELPVD